MIFEKLYAINVNENVEKKQNLSYLSWAWAWAELKKLYPTATYKIKKFGDQQLPYVYDENTGYMVFTEMTIEGITHEMWLPVMDGANMAMKSYRYDYNVFVWENRKKVWDTEKNDWKTTTKTVEQATMFDINKTIMRCLVKNIAMFGLGLYIYAGEDLPETEDKPTEKETTQKTKTKASVATDKQIELIKQLYTVDEINTMLERLNKDIYSLTVQEASQMIKARKK